MNRWMMVVTIALAVLLLASIVGMFFYGNYRYTAGFQEGTADLEAEVEAARKEGKVAGWQSYEDPANPGPELKKAWDEIAKLEVQLDAAPKPLKNPSYQELMDFLAEDQTDLNEYESPYYCAYFARDLQISARQAGFRVGFVALHLKGATYFLNVFETSDRGLIYIEPQNDAEVTVRIDEGYWQQNGWSKQSFDDTIRELVISW